VSLNDADLRKQLESWWDVPRRYIDCRFSNFDAYNETLDTRLQLVKRVASERQSALLFGGVGAGKTHLAVSVMAEWLRREARGKFVNAAQFVSEVQAAYGNPRAAVYDLLDQNHFMLLDDLGTERANETSRTALLFLIDQFYSKHKRMIVSSNLTPAELNAFEPRIASRLAEMGPFIEIKATDYRVKIAARRQKDEKS